MKVIKSIKVKKRRKENISVLVIGSEYHAVNQPLTKRWQKYMRTREQLANRSVFIIVS